MSEPGPLNLHASCVLTGAAGVALGVPEDAAVLIFGPSGAGKSAITLGIIARGGFLVADDRTLVSVQDGALWGEPHPRLAGLIEAREVGIVRLPYRAPAKIALAVELAPGPRMPFRADFCPAGADRTRITPPPLLRIRPDGGCIDKILLALAGFARDAFISNENPDPEPSRGVSPS